MAPKIPITVLLKFANGRSQRPHQFCAWWALNKYYRMCNSWVTAEKQNENRETVSGQVRKCISLLIQNNNGYYLLYSNDVGSWTCKHPIHSPLSIILRAMPVILVNQSVSAFLRQCNCPDQLWFQISAAGSLWLFGLWKLIVLERTWVVSVCVWLCQSKHKNSCQLGTSVSCGIVALSNIARAETFAMARRNSGMEPHQH